MINLIHDVRRDALSNASPLFISESPVPSIMSSSYFNPAFPTPSATGKKRKRSPDGKKGKKRATNDGEAANSSAEHESEEETSVRPRKKKAPSGSAARKKKPVSPSDWHLRKGEVPQGSEKTKVRHFILQFKFKIQNENSLH